jgi:tyrosine-protein phosphatase SIW14
MSKHLHLPSTIRNFRVVHEGLLRGGQPSAKELAGLSENGVRTVISLRTGLKAMQRERVLTEELGMNFVHLPVYYLSLPDDDMVEQFVRVLDDAANHPVFVHCFHGVDRTGFLIATYRMLRMGWQVEEAYAEWQESGFHVLRLPHFKWLLFRYWRRCRSMTAGGNNGSLFSVKRT